MTTLDLAGLEGALARLVARAPAGAVGVLHAGETVLEHAWGFADRAARLEMTPGTLLPICSISKQFTCGVLLDLVGDPGALDDRVAQMLPRLEGAVPTVAELCHNQSGLRDYWALTVLHGAAADGVFRREDARPLFGRMRTTQFAPGTRYSYSNGNFRLLSDIIEDRAGRSLGELYAARLFGPAGMETAALNADTRLRPGGTVGYEGNGDLGWFPAENGIFWTGDAGITASLRDMLAWERFIDATRDEAGSLYLRLSAPQTFRDGRRASYGFGVAHEEVAGLPATGHGGALRGFRLQRLHVAARRLSVVVMFNHEMDPHGAAVTLAEAALGGGAPQARETGSAGEWTGDYLDPETGLALRLEAGPDGDLDAWFATTPDRLRVTAEGAGSAETRITRDGAGLRLERPGDNLRTTLTRLSGEARPDIAGRYHAEELDGGLEVVATGGAFFGAFEGMLGRGEMRAMRPLAEDVWLLSCTRAMDAPAPGDWTVRVRRDAGGGVCGLGVGCWLARGVEYRRL